MWDDLDYNPGRNNNWGIEWCNNNADTELEQLTTGNGVSGYNGCGSCAHCGVDGEGNTINCVLKGRAVWWMMANLAGWNERQEQLCGDLDNNEVVDILDLRLLINNISHSGYPVDQCAGNVNGEGAIDWDDVWVLLMHLFNPTGNSLNC